MEDDQQEAHEERKTTLKELETSSQQPSENEEAYNKQRVMIKDLQKTKVCISIANTILDEAALILAETGLEVHDAIRLFLSQVVMHQGIPYGGFKSGLKPRPIKHSKKELARQRLLQDIDREDNIAVAKDKLKYHGGKMPNIEK